MPLIVTRRGKPIKGLKKKQPKKRRTGGMSIARIGSNMVRNAFIPECYYTKMIYTERVVLSSLLGIRSAYVWRGNSTWDPNFTGAGIQALGNATLNQLYEKRRVYSSAIKLDAVLTDYGLGEGAYELAVIPVSNGFGTVPDPEEIKMNPNGKFKIVGNQGGGSKISMSHKASVARVEGVTKAEVANDDTYGSLIVANPVNQFYWYVVMQPCDHSSTVDVVVYATITYYCKYYDRRPFNQGT